jgi:ATP-binding cassette subfamily C (CFTR/MRP) protein 2
LVTPFILQQIIDYLNVYHTETLRNKIFHGFVLIGCLMFVKLGTSLISQRVEMEQYICGVQSMTGLGILIYNKSLKLSNTSCKKFTQGKVLNLLQVDCMKMAPIVNQLATGVNLIGILILSIYLLYYFLGIVAFVGLGVCLVTVIINYFVAKISTMFEEQAMELKDERIKKTNEALQSVKILKMYGWCDLFQGFILKVRNKEIHMIQKSFFISGLFITSLYLFPNLVRMATFFLYAYVNGGTSMGIVFATINVFNIMSGPLRAFPCYVSRIVDAFVSSRRIQEFLESEEVSEIYLEGGTETENTLEINGCDFAWNSFEEKGRQESIAESIKSESSKEELKAPLLESSVNLSEEEKSTSEDSKKGGIALKNIKLRVKKGEFVFIVGEIGSGKSSLLHSVIGELKMRSSDPLNGDRVNLIKKSGSLAYVEQQPWIQNGTIKDNIMFISKFDEKKYKEVLRVCELEEDIEIFPAGDMTEIGERGINLSGGQKARVSLARAVYSDSDIYLLDDPLSALDSNVKNKIFYNCIANKLKGKTILLASHCIEYLEKADRILVLNEGEIAFDGSYSEFLKHDKFLSLLKKTQLTGQKSKKPKKKRKKKAVAKDESNTGKIIVEEEQSQDSVSMSIYKKHISSLGGVWFILPYSLIMVSWTFFSIGSDWWLGLWAQSESNSYSFLIMNSIFALCSVICILFRVFVTFFSSIRCSKRMHNEILTQIMRAPVNTFFDTVPIGRIINRLSNDLNTCDSEIPYAIGNVQMNLWRFIGSCLLCVLLIYWCVFPLPFISAVLLYYLRKYLQLQRKLRRLSMVSRSPIFQYEGESYSGAVTIRAYGVQENCHKRCHGLMDKLMKCELYATALDSWITLRVQLISLSMNILTVIFVVIHFNHQ